MATYATPDSGLLGGIPVADPSQLDAYFQDAADEIDAAIGFMYQTPVTRGAGGGVLPRPTGLVLARINRYLASGRYILAVAAAGEDSGLHAYGRSLVSDASTALKNIVSGANELDALRIPNEGAERRGPRVVNAESKSNVDAFYANMTGGDPTHEPGMVFSPTPLNPWEASRGW